MTKKKIVELLQGNNDTLRTAKQNLSACSSVHDIIETRILINDSIIREMAGDEEIE